MQSTEATGQPTGKEEQSNMKLVVVASSLGTVFEWYDFYIYGTLAAFFGALFFPSDNPTAGFLLSLATFGAGFAVRPFGAIVFGRLGDLIGRKHTFLITITVMGLATALVAFLPTYATIGIWAPIALVTLRLLQGLALGGEYGGAATYVAEHSPDERRGFMTSWIQTTATLGLLLSLAVILTCRSLIPADQFKEWGWRVPFALSFLLLIISIYIRLKLEESPVFKKMKREGRGSKSPLKDSFAKWSNGKYVVLALLGATAGQGVVWYTGQFHALFFLQTTLGVEYQTAYFVVGASLVLGTPFFVVFGALSDRIGRKKIMMAGFLLAAVTYIPIFNAITKAANPDLERASINAPVTVTADSATCNFNLFAGKVADCDKLREALTKRGVSYTFAEGAPGQKVSVVIGAAQLSGFDPGALAEALKAAGYPEKADPEKLNEPLLILLLTILVIYVTMVYGPIAAFLVELFPARIRYTSMSLPYHIGNGWFGGFLPFITAAISIHAGNIYAGLWYPIAIAVMSLVIGGLLIRETKHHKIYT